MYKFGKTIGLFLLLATAAGAQNFTAVTGTKTQNAAGDLLATGQLCLTGTDNTDTVQNYQAGGGGQVVRTPKCVSITAGVIASVQVANGALTMPAGIVYRVQVKDTSTGQLVIDYRRVSIAGATFNLDNYQPTFGNVAAPVGLSVTGPFSVTGNFAATGTVTGSNIPASFVSIIQSQGSVMTGRSTLNFYAGLFCADNAPSTRTDCGNALLKTVTFSATPTFDVTLGNLQKITLTGNVTSSTLSGAIAGSDFGLLICQDGVGGRTFVPPANVLQFATIPSTASTCALQMFQYDGTNAYPDLMPGLTGDVTSTPGSTATTLSTTGVSAGQYGMVTVDVKGRVTAATTATDVAHGGTGQTTQTAAFNALDPLTTLGDITYHNGTDSVRLPGQITTTQNVLCQTGNGSVSAAPAWCPSNGTGNYVRTISPSLTTPNIGAATAASVNIADQTGLQIAGAQTIYAVTADFTTPANTTLNLITGLQIPLPSSTALKVPFHCDLAYSIGTAVAAVSFGVQSDTQAPTNLFSTGVMYTSATASTEGNLPVLNSTTATAVVTATPSVITTVWNAYLDGYLEQPSGTATNLNILVKTAVAGDAVTVKRGSYCKVF